MKVQMGDYIYVACKVIDVSENDKLIVEFPVSGWRNVTSPIDPNYIGKKVSDKKAMLLELER